MNIIEAWEKAGSGQWIKRKCSVLRIRRGGLLKDLLHNWEYGELDLLADDWEVVREKHKIELCDTEFSGMFGSESITSLVYDKTGKPKPPRFTKVTLEWEE